MLLATIEPGARRYGIRQRNADVRACVSRAGDLTGLTITTSSGVTELDDAVIRAFQASAPFLNPPEALVQGDPSSASHSRSCSILRRPARARS
jgi:TonB family protein